MWVGTATGMVHVARDGAALPLENHGQDGDKGQAGNAWITSFATARECFG